MSNSLSTRHTNERHCWISQLDYQYTSCQPQEIDEIDDNGELNEIYDPVSIPIDAYKGTFLAF